MRAAQEEIPRDFSSHFANLLLPCSLRFSAKSTDRLVSDPTTTAAILLAVRTWLDDIDLSWNSPTQDRTHTFRVSPF